MDLKKIEGILVQHIPAGALDHCSRLWQELPFDFKLRKSRLSKVGDFTCRSNQSPQITVNKDLHPFLFLMTYVHEVAHLRVHQEYGFKAEAHGDAWKATFQRLMAPLLREEIFPEPLLSGLRRHMASPKASSFSDAALTELFRSVDSRERNTILLSQIPEIGRASCRERVFRVV